ncbi:hypothetical protein JQV27_20135 [Sulfitobacter mediterraneus]|uniref:hypothetical protein n=3 Tax=Sulfitobacter mediterraneus TaxID=83219 RepID=UPI00193180B8|nr:hypothetical protein [Sulfitobacter mediterraneus]MBM1647054.1 hypothetical protein [Sulfitobacter mediterraneus]MBM1651085.1 hypothetical protein [Sulfitobacter mediterraneus]MBM1655121.1 hypothetical protein [Sulfitobacter mediterraneus]MBM1659182.1 hypothetical protein [Sulfitobacter mediterraneus]MBM1663224.1 hypothetical protein [Sulfitobacter mediterraneus]
MSNIFNFRPKKTEPLNSDFLKDADDTVEFDLIGREAGTEELPQHFLRDDLPCPVLHDWSNQELANIYRVKKLLDAAGVPNTLERGITDEGDPWCIFCTHGGEVFIHLCRVDNLYTLDSPNLRNPITGVDFADLIAEFSAGALAKTPAASRSRVIQLQRNGKVFLHPSALLAALIWSIYINSEDLVMLAPEDEAGAGLGADDSINLLNEVALAPLDAGEATAVAHFMDTPLTADQIISARGAETERDGTMFRDFMGKSAMVASAAPIAVGLSSIAIAFGIMSESFFDPAADPEMAALDLPATEDSAEIAVAGQDSADASRNTAQFDLAAVLQSVLEQAPTPDVAPSALSTEIAADIDLSTLLSSILALPGPADVALSIAGGFQDSWADEAPVAFADKPGSEDKTASAEGKLDKAQTTRSTTTDTQIESADSGITASPDAAFDLASVLDFTASMADAFKTFDFGGVQIQATFDIASLTTTSSSDTASDAPDLEPVISDLLNTLTDPVDEIDMGGNTSGVSDEIYKPLDINAHAFIQYMLGMSSTGEVEVVQTQNELLLMDFDALRASAADTVQMGWTLADGNTVYTIGMREDYVEYDLIA